MRGAGLLRRTVLCFGGGELMMVDVLSFPFVDFSCGGVMKLGLWRLHNTFLGKRKG